MKNVLLLFWGKGGNVEHAAKKIYSRFNSSDIDMIDVVSFDVQNIKQYKLVILGGSTIGAENWRDVKADNEWNRFFLKLVKYDLTGMKIAAFGLGDQVLYPEHFVDGLGIFKDEIGKTKASLIGKWPTDGYTFTDSDGMKDGMFFGLALDLDQQDELTDERILNWTKQIKKEAGI